MAVSLRVETICSIVLFLCGTGVLSQMYVNPGLRVRTKEDAFNVFGKLAMDQFLTPGKRIPIPNQNGTQKFLLGSMDWKMMNNQVINFTKPVYKISIKPGKINLILSNAGVSINGNWSYLLKPLGFGDSGGINVTIAAVTVNVSIATTVSPSSGRPAFYVTDCSSNISGAGVKLLGGMSMLYNLLFSGMFADALQGLAQAKICEAVKSVVEVQMNAMVAMYPMQMDIGDGLVIDMSYTNIPTFGYGYVETQHNGTVFNKTNPLPVPFQAPPLPSADDVRQLAISSWISEYVPKTKAYALFKRGALKHNVTQSALPESMRGLLSTTCSKDTYCIGNIIPQIASKFPNSVLEVEMVVTSAPNVIISTSGVQASCSKNATFRIRLPDGSLTQLFTVSINVTVQISPRIEDGKIKATINRIQPNVTLVTNSAIGPIPNGMLSDTFDSLAKQFVLPMLQAKANYGYPIPVPELFKLKNPSITTLNSCLFFTSDIEPKA